MIILDTPRIGPEDDFYCPRLALSLDLPETDEEDHFRPAATTVANA